MFNQTDTKFVSVSQMAEDLVAFGRNRHERYRIITDFQGTIDKPVISASGDMVYMGMNEEDRMIIPKAAFKRLAAAKSAGFRVVQVIIGHELEIATEMPENRPRHALDWENIMGNTAKVVLAGISGIATVAFYALSGALLLFDPSLCIVLDDEVGTVVELMRWNTEA